MDPGNWATDIEAGSSAGYRLLFVLALSGLTGLVLQLLAAKLGIATGLDLAQACRDRFGQRASLGLWVLAEIGICACDLAELLGTALGLKLLFGVPLAAGVALTVLDVLLILPLGRRGLRRLTLLIVALMAVVTGCFAVLLAMAAPDLVAVATGFLPHWDSLRDPHLLFIAVGILGATVMPHNLYLHSSLVRERAGPSDIASKREAYRGAAWDSGAALALATLVNAAILILAAAAFHSHGQIGIADIGDAYRMFTPLLGPFAALLFAIALIASGQNSSLTATMAGQVVMEGFTSLRLSPVQRRLLTRAIAALPALAAIAILGEGALGNLLVLSQVVLSLQLPFAVVPLVMLTSDRGRMGPLANSRALSALAWTLAGVIVLLDAALLLR